MLTDPTVLRPNISDVAILIFAATCQQGTYTELKGIFRPGLALYYKT